MASLAEGWLRGDAIQALAFVEELDQDRYKVRGLDEFGHPTSFTEKLLDAFDDTGAAGYVAVRGDHPGCAAVGLYKAVGAEHSWLAVTTHRLAVLRLRDRQGNAPDPSSLREEKTLGGALRGIGKFVKDSATEFAKSMRRPPLHERPEDATLECPFELPRHALRTIERWKQPLVPEFRGGPRFIQVHFTDNSWTRLKTTEQGQSALT